MRGRFITFEGPDKAGKSTQIKLFCEYLDKNGIRYILTREPGGCPVCEKIREVILDPKNDMGPLCEAMLYAASRSEHVRSVIAPALKSGMNVVCDRYVDSSIVYQGFGRGLGYDYVMGLNSAAIGGIMPDITFYLALSPEESEKRMTGEKDRLESEGGELMRLVNEGYAFIKKKEPERFAEIDASQSIEAVHREIREAFEKAGLLP